MCLSYLPKDILQYIINPYINYTLNQSKLENIINKVNSKFKFKNTSHLKIIVTSDVIYNPENMSISNVSKIKRYIDNKLHGRQLTFYYPEFKIHSIKSYKNNVQHGLEKVWYKNGILHSKGSYKNNKLIGTWKTWHVNGIQKSEEIYYNNDSTIIWYNDNGEIKNKEIIVNYKLLKNIYYQYENGNIILKSYYRYNRINHFIEYKNIKYKYKNDKIIETSYYKDDILYKITDKNGKKIDIKNRYKNVIL